MKKTFVTFIYLQFLFILVLSQQSALNLENKILDSLNKQIVQNTNPTELVKGQGFKYLNLASDVFSVTKMKLQNLDKFLQSYIPTLNLDYSVQKKFIEFTSLFQKAKIMKWQHQNFMKTNQFGKGYWLGIYFRKLNQYQCQFYSNKLNIDYHLMPNVYAINQRSGGNILGIGYQNNNINIFQQQRGLNKQDIIKLMSWYQFVKQSKNQ